jgi:tetratricopeptide (TPR) repeat protein
LRTIVVVFALLLGSAGLHAQSVRFIDAMKNYQAGEFTEARKLFEAEVKENPENDAAWYYLSAIASTDEARSQEAETFLKKAVALSPDNFWYRYTLAMMYVNTDRRELAVPVLEQLSADYPKKSDLQLDLINLYLSENDVEKALATLDRIDAIRGKNEIVGLTRAELKLKQPRAEPDLVYAELADYYEECRSPRIASILGDYYAGTYRDSLALRYYDEALAIAPDYTPAWYGKAGVYQMLRQYDRFFTSFSHVIRDPNVQTRAKAEYVDQLLANPQFVRTFADDFEQMMLDLRSLHPDDPLISNLVGSYYYRTNRPQLSVEVMRESMERNPEIEDCALQYLLLLYTLQSWPELAEAATVAIQRFPTNQDFLQLRAIAYSQQKNYEAAIGDYQAILNLNPRDTTVAKVTYASIGDTYYQLGESKKAFNYYEKALKIDPDYNPVLNNYAYYLSLEGKNLKKAKEMSRKTITTEPDNPTYLDTYAWILHLLGDDIEAKALFKHAMLYGGKESRTILTHYAIVLEKLGETDLANIYYNQAKAMTED